MASRSDVIEKYYFENLVEHATSEEFLAELPKHPGCAAQIVASGTLEHRVRCMRADEAGATMAFVNAVLAERPDLRKDGHDLLEAVVSAKELEDPVRLETLRTAIALGADPKKKALIGRSPMVAAVELGLEVVTRLFTEATSDHRVETLAAAVEFGDVGAVQRLLLSHRQSPDDHLVLIEAIRSCRGGCLELTASEEAALARRLEIAHLLIERGIGITAPEGQHSPLHEAASNGDIRLVAALIEKGAPVEAVDRSDRDLTPLKCAAMFRSSEHVFPLLFAHAALSRDDLAGPGWEWLWHCFSPATALALARRCGADIRAAKSQLTLLHVVASSGSTTAPVVRELIEMGGDPTARTSRSVHLGGRTFKKGTNPLQVAKVCNHDLVPLLASTSNR